MHEKIKDKLIRIYGFHELKLWPFLNMPIIPGSIRSGTKLSLLTEAVTGLLCRVKEAIHIRLHPNNINRDSGIEIPEGSWSVDAYNQTTWQQISTAEDHSASCSHNANNALDRNPPTTSEVCDTPITNNHGGTNSSTQISKSTLSPGKDLQPVRSKRRDQSSEVLWGMS